KRLEIALSGWKALRAEQLVHGRNEPLDAGIGQRVKDLLSFLAPDNQVGGAQLGQLLGEARLAQIKGVFELAHRAFTIDERAANQQPVAVSELLQEGRSVVGL